MNCYCTYFDSGYLAQGVALWHSLAAHDPSAELWVLALDDDVAAVLCSLASERLHIVPLATLLADDAEAAAARSDRSRSEFIFLLTPCFARWLLRTQPNIAALAYVDADLCFFSDPMPLWRELEQGSVLVVEHGFPRWHDDAPWYGRFNVGVVLFRADENGRACLDDWRERCLESCALTRDGVHYGDQKYLDAWPERFDRVIVSRHAGVNVGPWNWMSRRFIFTRESIQVNDVPLIVFHFAQFRRVNAGWFDSGQLEYGIMPLRLRSRLYGEYWRRLERAEREIRKTRPGFHFARRGWRVSLQPWWLALLRLGWGQFWFRLGPWWLAGRLGLGRFSGRCLGEFRRRQRRRWAVPGPTLTMEERGPRILVVTPTLGESPWLDETVASVAAHPECRHVLVAPATAGPALSARFPHCRVVAEPPQRRGMYAAINAGVAAESSWDAVTYINDDDLLLPEFSRIIARARVGDAAFVYGGVELIDAEGRRIGAIATAPLPAHLRLLYAQRIEGVFQQGTLIGRAAWTVLGGFDETFRFCGDSNLFARACVKGLSFVRATRRPVGAFRLRPGQLSKNREAMGRERAAVDQGLGLIAPRRTLRHHWARWWFRLDNFSLYLERVRRHGWLTFAQQIERSGTEADQ